MALTKIIPSSTIHLSFLALLSVDCPDWRPLRRLRAPPSLKRQRTSYKGVKVHCWSIRLLAGVWFWRPFRLGPPAFESAQCTLTRSIWFSGVAVGTQLTSRVILWCVCVRHPIFPGCQLGSPAQPISQLLFMLEPCGLIYWSDIFGVLWSNPQNCHFWDLFQFLRGSPEDWTGSKCNPTLDPRHSFACEYVTTTSVV